MKWFIEVLNCFLKTNKYENKDNLVALPVKMQPKREEPGTPVVDWSDRKSKISKYFTVHEATYLPSWGTWHSPTEKEKVKILETARIMDLIRDILQKPIKVNVWIRPTKYNAEIGGAQSSSHIYGSAVDWKCIGMHVDVVLNLIQPLCDEYEFALENNGSVSRIEKNNGKGGPRNWIHLQIRPLIRSPRWRIFNP